MHEPELYRNASFTRPQRIATALNTLDGILKGIAIDGKISPAECQELLNWCYDKKELLSKHPFSELVPLVQAAAADGTIDPGEQSDILWMCDNLSNGLYYDARTGEIQKLQGILHGILADGVITEEEAKELARWLTENDHLKGTYPFDELDSLLTGVLADGKIDEEEQHTLKSFFEEFISYSMARRISNAREAAAEKSSLKLPGICSLCPDIVFAGRTFCFTGTSLRAPRKTMMEEVQDRGGLYDPRMGSDLSYLVVGAGGNPCWAFSCYGRKVETAVKMRRSGLPVAIVHENDFWDALAGT